ncbi:MAG: serine/threonine protein kinase [Candidatus Hydrogenedentes bacterium]|nr:serine/threonine protein kinase [Candidatus Hydrogenedentota bacterium]
MVSQNSGHASLIGSAFGGYEVQALIGRGAMGTVYLARDVALGRPVALKVLLGSLARNPGMVRGFYREAQAAAPLRHPNIVRVYTAGIESGTPYIAMEYVPGEPLDRFLRRKGQVSWQAALYVGAQVAEALHCAHDAGIIHRDVKPANILLDRQGRVRLTDFGIARVCTVENSGAEPKVIGTPQYMSPEQCAGDEVTHSTDLYSLGVTLYQMISGRMPFKADSAQELMRRIASDEAPRLNRVVPDVPDDVARLVAHLLQKNSAQRPASARDVIQMIARLQSEDGGRSAIPQALAAYVREQAQDSPLRVLTPPPSRDKAKTAAPEAKTVIQKPRPTRWLLGASLATVLAIFGIAVKYVLTLGESRNAAPAPVLEAATFTKQSDGAVVASVNADAYHPVRIGWSGRERALLVEASADPASILRGAAGVLAVEPERARIVSVVTPAGALLSEGFASAQAAPMALTSGMRNATTVPAVLLGQRNASGEKSTSGLVYLQRWNESAPSLNPAAVYETAATPDVYDSNNRCAHAVLRPDGGAICLLTEREDGTSVLSERKVYASSTEKELKTNGGRILAESLQYTPSGDRVVYIRVADHGKQELWSAPTNGSASTLLAIGFFDGEAAISPQGDRIAAAWSAAAGAAPELHIISSTDGKTLQRLGDATVGHDAWLNSGEAIVIAKQTEQGVRQLCLKDSSTQHEGELLTSLESGVGKMTAVSADGAWAAGVVEGGDGVHVVFVPLAQRENARVAANESTMTGRGNA